MSWFDEGGSGSPVDVVAIMDSKVPVLIAEIVAEGCLVSLGTTQDGGTMGVTVTLDGRWRRCYSRQSEELEAFLESALAGVQAEKQRPAASTGQRRRSRRPQT